MLSCFECSAGDNTAAAGGVKGNAMGAMPNGDWSPLFPPPPSPPPVSNLCRLAAAFDGVLVEGLCREGIFNGDLPVLLLLLLYLVVIAVSGC